MGGAEESPLPRAESRGVSDRPRVTLALIVALGFATRLGMCLLKAVVCTDAFYYVKNARAILDGRWHDAVISGYHPGYPALVALFALPLRNVPFAAHSVSILLGALTAIPAWHIARRAFDARTALFAALLVAVLPEAVDEGSDILVEASYLFFFLASVALTLRAASTLGWPETAGAGLCAGAAYLIRPEGLAAAAVGVPAVLAAGRILEPRSRRRCAAAILLGLACAAVAAPYVGALRAGFGRWTLTAKSGGDAFKAAAPPRDTSESGKSVEEKRSANPLYLPWFFARKLAISIYPPFLALFVFALWPAWRPATRPPPESRLARWVLVALLAVYLPPLFRLLWARNYISTRHLLAPAVLLLFFAAAGAARLSLRHSFDSLRSLRTGGNGLVVVVLLLCAVSLPKILRPHRTEMVPLKEAGLWLRANHPGELFAGPEKVAFYAETDFVQIRSRDPNEVWDSAAARHLHWVVTLEEDEEGLAAKLDPRFELVKSWGDGGNRVTIFRVSP